MKDTIQKALNSTIEAIDGSCCDEPTKIYYRNLITRSGECTNGLSKEEKIQGMSEVVFYLSELFVRRDIDNAAHFKNIDSKLDSLSAKLDTLVEKLENVESKPKSRLEIVMSSLSNIQWWWAAAVTAIVAILAYHDHIIEVLTRLLQ